MSTTSGRVALPRLSRPRLLRAVLAKELRGRMRGWRAPAVLTVYLLVLSGFTLLVYLAVTAGRRLATDSGPPVGQAVFLSVVGFQLALVAFLAPAFSAGVISGEREKQTYDLLLTTPLPPWVIVLGKLLGALTYLLLLIVAGLPLASLGYLLGGVALDEVAVAASLLLVTTFTYGAVGLWFSARLRSTTGATVLAYAAILVPLVGIPLAAILSTPILSSIYSDALPPWLIYSGGYLLSLNPLIAGGLTEWGLVAGKGLGLFEADLANTRLLVASPWLVLVVSYLSLFVVLVLTSIPSVRPASSKRR